MMLLTLLSSPSEAHLFLLPTILQFHILNVLCFNSNWIYTLQSDFALSSYKCLFCHVCQCCQTTNHNTGFEHFCQQVRNKDDLIQMSIRDVVTLRLRGVNMLVINSLVQLLPFCSGTLCNRLKCWCYTFFPNGHILAAILLLNCWKKV